MKFTKQNLYLPTKFVVFANERPGAMKFLVEILHEIMIKNNGIGLAANQLGIRKSCFVMNIDGRKFNVFNPVITAFSKEECIIKEGCLSFPKSYIEISRPKEIHVCYQDELKAIHQENLDGMAARCFQHEYDHLQGITMFQRYQANNILAQQEVL